MLTVFYSPHSSSVDNEAGRASGHADVPLSSTGQQQAHKLGQDYAGETFAAVFCSDLQRAYITAEIAFSARGLPIVRDARLRECNYGTRTQSPPEELELEKHVTEPFPKGESLFMVIQRMGAFLSDVIRDYDGKTIVVIGHRATYYGLKYWSGDALLEGIVRAPWEWAGCSNLALRIRETFKGRQLDKLEYPFYNTCSSFVGKILLNNRVSAIAAATHPSWQWHKKVPHNFKANLSLKQIPVSSTLARLTRHRFNLTLSA